MRAIERLLARLDQFDLQSLVTVILITGTFCFGLSLFAANQGFLILAIGSALLTSAIVGLGLIYAAMRE
jgi:hypothetical protein